jgi:RNA polymerase sigma-70 factor (ECF subfamily)
MAADTLPDPSPDRADDEWLVVRCQLGEPEAFDALIARWYPPLWLYIRRMAGNDDDARDLTQELWLRVLRGLGRLRDASRLRAWLFGIARRLLMDRLRDKYAASLAADVDVATLAAAELDTLDREADIASLEAALDALPPVEREVLTLFYLRDLSLAELADTLGVPVGTVKSRLFRARAMLRAAMPERMRS